MISGFAGAGDGVAGFADDFAVDFAVGFADDFAEEVLDDALRTAALRLVGGVALGALVPAGEAIAVAMAQRPKTSAVNTGFILGCVMGKRSAKVQRQRFSDDIPVQEEGF